MTIPPPNVTILRIFILIGLLFSTTFDCCSAVGIGTPLGGVFSVDSTGKLCPRPFVSIMADPDGDSKWEDFKLRVSNYIAKGVTANFI